jgi:hypothetical protein
MSLKSRMVAKARAVSITANIPILMYSLHDREKAGVPIEAGRLLELCFDCLNQDIYINIDGGTTWAKIVD